MINATEYQYQYNNNKTCIKVRTDVVFTMTNWKEIITFGGTNFTVRSGDCALPGEEVATLVLSNTNYDFLDLTFIYDAQNQTFMDARFNFAPYKYFPNTPTPNLITMIDDSDLILGGNMQLYMCNPRKSMTLKGRLDDITYTMQIDMSNTEIQAFNIEDGILSSDVNICEAEQMNSTP